MRKFIAGLGALIAIATILVGVPIVLVLVAGNPLPTGLQWHQIFTLVPDYGNEILIFKILPCIAWIAWALFALPLLIETVARAAGRTTSKTVRIFRPQQQLSTILIAAVLSMTAASGINHTPQDGGSGVPDRASTTSISSVSATPASSVPQPILASLDTDGPSTPVSVAAAPDSVAPDNAAPDTTDVIHTVLPGDTLWGISEKYYGVGTRDLDIFNASSTTMQPHGQRLTNPDLIRPGWQLTVPGVTATVPTPTPATAPAPAQLGPSESGSLQNAPTQQQENTPGPSIAETAPPSDTSAGYGPKSSPHSDAPTSEDEEIAIPLTVAGGLSMVIATGLILAISRRRLNQRRARKPGQRIAMPDGDAAQLEQNLRLVADPVGLSDINHALQLIHTSMQDAETPLPELLAVRLLETEITFYFLHPVELPDPFTQFTPERTVWTVKPAYIPKPDQITVHPYPALITIGVDAHGGMLLVDFEGLGLVSVTGEEHHVEALIAALTVELSCNPWGEDILVITTGQHTPLPSHIDPFRIKHIDDAGVLIHTVSAIASDRSTALSSYDMSDVHTARIKAAKEDSWEPNIILLPDRTDERFAQVTNLVTTFPGLGIAVIGQGNIDSGAATIRVDSATHAELILPNGITPPLPFSPQLLERHELAQLQQIFDTTEHEAVSPHNAVSPHGAIPPGADSLHLPASEPSPTLAEVGPEGFDQGVVSPIVEGEPEVPATTRERDDPQPESAPVGVVSEVDVRPVLPASPPQISVGVPSAPSLRLLGPVSLNAIGGDSSMPGRGVELITYLHLKGALVSGTQIQKDFWPNTVDASNALRSLVLKTRRALGSKDATTMLLPSNANHSGYTLDSSIRSDWVDFHDLIGSDVTTTSTDHLITALRLVKGTPFSGCDTRQWWQWMPRIQEDMMAAVMDAANELGTRALQSSNYSLARFAAHIQQSVDPLNEAGWRIELRAALQSRNLDLFHSIIDQMRARVGGNDPTYEFDDETQHLIDGVRGKARA
jgi:LysM repeat protein